jgi:AcrR family transcriptional regulator
MQHDQKQLLLKKAGDLFKKYGVKNLTMDDVAKELGMSKKTIYRHVENKAELVQLALMFYLEADRKHLEGILKASENSVDSMIRMIAYFVNQVTEFDASVLLDIQKYYIETWELYNDYRYKYVLSLIADNLKGGMEEGYYRNDFDPDIISKIYISATDILADQRLFPSKNYVFLDIFKEFVKYHLCGIASPKGLEYIEQHNLFGN